MGCERERSGRHAKLKELFGLPVVMVDGLSPGEVRSRLLCPDGKHKWKRFFLDVRACGPGTSYEFVRVEDRDERRLVCERCGTVQRFHEGRLPPHQ